MDVDGKYIVKETVFGSGTWAVVRECVPVNGYVPPGYEALRGVTSSGDSNPAMPKLVAKIIDKEKLKTIVNSEDGGHGIVARELAILESLPPHVQIVRFVECIDSEKNYFLIFEAAIHGDLCELLLKSPTQRLDESSGQKYIAELIYGLLHCHRHGVCHRDLKPENILVAAGNVLKLADFGLAKTASGGLASASFSMSGAGPTSSEPDAPHPAQQDATLSLLFPHRIFPKGTSLQTIIIEHRLRRASASGGLGGGGGGSSSHAARLATAAALASAMDVPILPSMLPAAPPCPGHEIMGTFRYGAPEMFEAKFSNGSFDAFTADAWSMGVVAFIMLTGTFPFSAGSNADERQTWKVLRESPLGLPLTREEGGETSAEACDFLKRLLEKNPARRMKLWDALDHPWLSGEVRRQQHLARDCCLLPPRVPPSRPAGHSQHVVSILSDNSSPEFAAACQKLHPLSPALEQFRRVLSKSDASSSSSGGGAAGTVSMAELKSVYNALVTEHYHKADAMARLRQSLAFGGPEDQRAAVAAAAATAAASGANSARSASAGRVVRGTSPSGPAVRATTPTGTTRTSESPNVGGLRGTTVGRTTPQPGRTQTPTRVAVLPQAAGSSRASPSPSTGQTIRGASAASAAASPAAGNNGGGSTAATNIINLPMNSARPGNTQTPLTRVGAGARRTITPARIGGTTKVDPTSGSTTARGGGGVSLTAQQLDVNHHNSSSSSTNNNTRRTSPSPSTNRASMMNAASPNPPVPRHISTAAADGSNNPANIRSLAGIRGAVAAAASATATPVLGDSVSYKNFKAIVRFVGPTKFAPGQWIGLELLEGDGLHDGTSSIDKKRYFSCPPGKGVFVKSTQLGM